MTNHIHHIPSASYLKLALLLVLQLCISAAFGQEKLTLNEILDRVQTANPLGKMYDADIRSMDEAAKGAKSWMPPEVGAGFFMTPYNPQKWKKMSDMEPGMGSFMISAQQMIPNRKKQNADAAYMESMSAATSEQKKAAFNELFSQAKKAYYEWAIIEKKKSVLIENEKLLEFMIRNAELRYKNGLEKINAYYKAKAALGKVQSMLAMQENESLQRRIILNSLMYRDKNLGFTIDTSVEVKNYSNYVIDSSLLVSSRSDLRAIDKEIFTNHLMQTAERLNLKPQFGVRFEHMATFGAQPQQFTLMGMARLPIVPWASRMTRANIESYKWKTQALKKQKEMVINESIGMAFGMRNEIEAKSRQIKLYENTIIPALRNNYKTMLLAYEQNTEELFMLYDAWESLNMTQNDYLDQVQQLLVMQVELERILERKN